MEEPHPIEAKPVPTYLRALILSQRSKNTSDRPVGICLAGLWSILLGIFVSPASAQVVNLWPIFVGEGGDGTAHAFGTDYERWNGGTILLFNESVNGIETRGFRPFHVRHEDPASGNIRGHVVYPVFNYRIEDGYFSWNIFYFLNFKKHDPDTSDDITEFNIFPFIFYRNTPDPARSHFGFFPIAGNVTAKFGNGRIDWFLFPIYGKFQENNVTTTTMPWPFIKTMSGEGNHGFEIWPFYGSRHKEGAYRENFILWPFIMTRDEKLWLEQPEELRAYLPFYFRHTTGVFENKSYPWPFVGRTDSVFPKYQEKRYFWPLFVQTRGDSRYINRWAPFYTHSIRKGVDKNWVMWPLYRSQTWTEQDLAMRKTQFLYILYWNLIQQRPGNVDGPKATRTHFWPFSSYWNNGAGDIQFQFLSPLEPFFPYNRDDFVRHNALFNFFTYRRESETTQTDIGPLVGWGKGENGSHFNLLKGFLGYERKESDRTYRLFWIRIGGSERTLSSP